MYVCVFRCAAAASSSFGSASILVGDAPEATLSYGIEVMTPADIASPDASPVDSGLP